MNKKLLLLLGGIFFLLGGILLLNNSSNKINKKLNLSLNEEEAKKIVFEKLSNVLKIYEEPSKIFTVKDVNDKLYLEIEDYKILEKEVTLNYKKILENVSINNNKLIVNKDNKVMILKPIANIKYNVNNAKIEILSMNENKIESDIIFSTHHLNDRDELEYKVVVKKIELIKNGDLWLTNHFNY